MVNNLSEEIVDRDVAEYLALLDSRTDEIKLHDFLRSHSYFFNGMLRMDGLSPLYSKVKLGHDYEVDFAWFDANSFGPEWRLAEIESPSKPMLTKAGSPSSCLLHAIQQVRDWHDWLHENLDYAQKLFPHIQYPLGFVFVGRRREVTSATERTLRRLIYDHRMFVEIHTLDYFADAALSIKNLECRWPLPLVALSHHNLAKGLPRAALSWMKRYREGNPLYLPNERLSERSGDPYFHIDSI